MGSLASPRISPEEVPHKFVAHGHGADLLEDYIKNFSIYEAALNKIAANHTNQDT